MHQAAILLPPRPPRQNRALFFDPRRPEVHDADAGASGLGPCCGVGVRVEPPLLVPLTLKVQVVPARRTRSRQRERWSKCMWDRRTGSPACSAQEHSGAHKAAHAAARSRGSITMMPRAP